MSCVAAQDRRRSRGECPIRVVEYRIATTLLDPQQAPATTLRTGYLSNDKRSLTSLRSRFNHPTV